MFVQTPLHCANERQHLVGTTFSFKVSEICTRVLLQTKEQKLLPVAVALENVAFL